MYKKSDSRNRAEKRGINGFQPVFISAGFYDVFQHAVTLGDQLSAVFHITFLTIVRLTYRRILYFGWDAEKLSEQVHGFSDMPEYEPNGCCFGIQPEGCIVFADLIQGEVTRELILLQDFKQDFFLHTVDSSPCLQLPKNPNCS